MRKKIFQTYRSLWRHKREITPSQLKDKNKVDQVLRLAVKRMLPEALAKKQLTKLKIYSGADHPHKEQNPKTVDFLSLNKKNKINL